MGNIVITTNVSLDGVVQDPDGQEGFRLGGWFVHSGGEDLGAWAELETAEARDSAAPLLGRRSDEWFAARWLGRDGEWAERLNSLPKYVVSSTLADPQWTNATMLTGDVVDEVTRLRQHVDVLGDGDRLFGNIGDIGDQKPLRLLEARTVGHSLSYLRYELLPRGRRGG